MNMLRKLLGIRTPEEALLVQLGIDPQYRDRKLICDGLTFRRTSLSELEATLPFRDPRIEAHQFRISLIGVDQIDTSHRELIQKIRQHIPTLFGHAVEAILGLVPSDQRNFRVHAKNPSIMVGEEDGQFDGRSWSMVFSWGGGGFGYHVEFEGMDLIEVWGGD